MRHRLALAAVLALSCGVLTAATGASAAPGRGTERDRHPGGRAGAIERAAGHLLARADAVRTGAGQTVTVRDVVLDADGGEHVRFDRAYRGLEVLGGDFVVHGRGDGAFVGASVTISAPLRLSTRAGRSAAEATRTAVRRFTGRRSAVSSADLVVFARTSRPALAYRVVVHGTYQDGTPAEFNAIVDAQSGKLLDSFEDVEPVEGSGTGYYNGPVPLQTTPIRNGYSLKDPTRGGTYTIDMGNKTSGGKIVTDGDNIWGNGLLSNRQTTAVDAQYGAAQAWDYYLLVHGRNGIANDGNGSYNRVHYGTNYNSAFWSNSCFCMTYGDGDNVLYTALDSLDVVGHEMSHGVTSRTANLTYSGESGGLNESTSDIFGSMVEFRANNTNDPGDYQIGEEIRLDGRPLRWMDKPSKDGKSVDCWYAGVGSLNVHYSSGVGNHFYYLLSQGSGLSAYGDSPTCDGSTVTGIGNLDAEKIWYRALTVYMTSSTNYAGARAATLSAATDLFGAESVQRATVAAAWSAVNVN